MLKRLYLVGLFSLLFVGPVAADLKLADFRRVVTADRPSLVQKAAAAELADYVGRIVGRKVEIFAVSKLASDAPGLSFFVGDAAKHALGREPGPWKEEEYLLRTVTNGIVLAGDDDPVTSPWSISTRAGSLLAVYTLLDDHLGVRWFWPGPFGEHVPSRPDATLKELDIRATPAFAIRSMQLGYSSYHTKEFHEEGRKWARRSRLGWVRSAVFGHSWNDAFDLRKDTTFKEHPDWFALVKGQRKPPQMCTTNPAVIERMVEHVVKGKPAIGNISPSDGGGFCECERCKKLDVPGVLSYDKKHVQLSDRIFTYANEVARGVREKDPNKGVGMFAYTYYNRPPIHIKQLEPNVYLSFVYQAAGFRNPEYLKEWHESVAGWKQLGAKLVVREGWGNHYYHDLPFLHYRQIIANLAEAQKLGFIAAYGEGSKSFATQAPNHWAITRMLWDPKRDPAQVMPDFYHSAYGPAAEAMEAFFETYSRSLDANWSKLERHVDANAIAYANIIGVWSRLLPPEVVAKADEHLDRAEKLAPTGEYADRVRFHRFGQRYTKVMLELLESYRQLAELGIKLDTFSSVVKTRREDANEQARLLKRANDLGEQREEMLLAHRNWAGPDEGLYAFTNDSNIRQWHSQVKRALGIDSPSALTKTRLAAP